MKKIENIFSRSKIKSPPPKNSIIIDTRETKSNLVEELYKRQIKIKFKKLDIGDYLIGKCLIERKTFSDFVSSILDKRLFNQLEKMKNLKNKYILIENFDFDYQSHSIHSNAIRGAIISIAIKYKIPLIYTKNAKDTCDFLIIQLKKLEKTKAPKQN